MRYVMCMCINFKKKLDFLIFFNCFEIGIIFTVDVTLRCPSSYLAEVEEAVLLRDE